MYVYIKTESARICGDPNVKDLFTVGYYLPDGTWQPESDHSDSDQAAARVHYLNGGELPSDEKGSV